MPQPQERLLSESCSGETPCARISLAQETLQRFGWVRFRATGSSMLPAIVPGDLLSFRAATPQELVPGQVVLVQDRDRLVVHRLLAHENATLIMRGDSLRAADAPVCTTRLLGVLEAQQRDSRQLPLGRSHRRLLPRTTRWLLRHVPIAHRIARRWPRLAALAA